MKKIFPLGIGLSLMLNVALAVWLARGSGPSGALSASSPSLAAVAPPPPPASSPSPVAPPPETAVSAWATVRRGDLPAMVTRLRAAGFPPAVIRAILGAELGQEFIARRKELDPGEETRPFWQTRPADPRIAGEINRLSRAHAKIVRDLLGPDDAENPLTGAYQSRRLQGLPPEKVEGVKGLLRDYDDMRAELIGGGMLPPAAREKLVAIDKAQQADLAQMLSPTELFEYGVRSSPIAENLRRQLSAFQPTEAEFRAIYEAQAAHDAQFGSAYGPLTAEQQRQRTEAQKQLTEQIKAALGAERGADYVRSQDHNYQLTSQLVARLDLPAETAGRVWAVQQDIQQLHRALAADRTLSAETRAQTLAALADEAGARISATLGARGFEAYKQYGGQWLQQLQPGSPPGAPAATPTNAPVMIFGR